MRGDAENVRTIERNYFNRTTHDNGVEHDTMRLTDNQRLPRLHEIRSELC
jgi:hypothetical protein